MASTLFSTCNVAKSRGLSLQWGRSRVPTHVWQTHTHIYLIVLLVSSIALQACWGIAFQGDFKLNISVKRFIFIAKINFLNIKGRNSTPCFYLDSHIQTHTHIYKYVYVKYYIYIKKQRECVCVSVL